MIANTIELPLIKRRYRAIIFRIRNLFFILSILSVLLFIITIPFINNLIFESINLFLVKLFICLLSGTILLSFTLMFRTIVGVVVINNNSTKLKLGPTEITLDGLVIILNADEPEFNRTLKSPQDINLLPTGNYIHSNNLSSEQASFELLISKENRIRLFELPDSLIRLKPGFKLRPLLMESPLHLFNTFFSWLRGWI